MGAVSDLFACDATVLQIKPEARSAGASSSLVGALWRRSRHKRVQRGSVANKTQGAFSRPGRGRVRRGNAADKIQGASSPPVGGKES